jgi:hypothetical protein
MNSKLSGWVTVTVDQVKSTDVEGVGNLRQIGEKTYRWVKNADAAVDFVAGEAAYHKITDTTTLKQNVYQALTANLAFLAGIVQGALTHGSYGWIQVLGPCSISVSGATTGGTDIAAGDWLKGANTKSYLVRDGASTAQATYARAAQTLVAVGTTTTPAAALVAGFISALD